MKRTKRIASALLALFTAAFLSMPVFASAGAQDAAIEDAAPAQGSQQDTVLADTQTYSGNILAAVNPNYDTDTRISGYFSSTAGNPLSAASAAEKPAQEQAGIADVYADPDTGETFYIREPELPALPESEPAPGTDDGMIFERESSTYGTGSTMTLKSVFNDGDTHAISMKCLYTGTYCTVWGSTSDNSSICINASQAEKIGQQFDSAVQTERSAFGSYWCDADGDGKVAIMCYDIDGEYGTSVSTYTAGYFYNRDLINSRGYINSKYFGAGYYLNGLDCIHIDTYPGMGKRLDNISRCYSTLVHEYQHMVNFSYCVKGTYFSPMDTYLNEAFSMGAEHMIFGASATASRITYFNGSSYAKGSALTCWDGTLSNYSNSYLFGQYIRTRYAQTGKNGNAVYKAVLEQRSSSNTDTLGIIAGLLNTTKKQLLLDFWTAVAVKSSSGKYGFNGESWANAIEIPYSSLSSGTSGIYNGGVKYYPLNGKTFTPASSSNVSFVAMDDSGPIDDLPQITGIRISRASSEQAELSFTPSKSGSIRYVITSGSYVTDHSKLSQGTVVPVTAGQQTTISFSPGGADYDDMLRLSFDLVSNTGTVSTAYGVKIPPYRYSITYECGENGSLQLLDGTTPVKNDAYVIRGRELTVIATPDADYELQFIDVIDRATGTSRFVSSGSKLTVDSSYLIRAQFTRVDPAPADAFASGTGTQADPYVIADIAQWKYFAERVNGGDSMKGKYITTSTALLLGELTLEPVGKSASTPFAGTFSGGQFLYIGVNGGSRLPGLFGVVTGTVRDLSISGCDFFADSGTTTELYVGTVASRLFEGGTIENCKILACGATISNASRAYGRAGGIVGENRGTIRGCCLSASAVRCIDSSNSSYTIYVGGIAGVSTGTIENCHVSGSVYANLPQTSTTLYIGGICGSNGGSILNCAAPGPYSTGGKTVYSGGICGDNSSSGSSYSTISGCVCYGEQITATAADACTGGIVGRQGQNGTIQNCLAAAESAQSANAAALGFIVGRVDAGTVTNCYYADSMTCTGTDASGMAASTAQLQSEDWVLGTLKLDTADIWEVGLHPTIDAPTLKLFRLKTGVPIQATADQGTVSVLSPAFIGTTVTVEMVEDDLVVGSVTVDGRLIEGDSFVVQSQPSHTVQVTTAKACRITVIQPQTGTITVSRTKVRPGDTITVRTSTDIYATIYVDGKELSGSSFVVTGDHTVTAQAVSAIAGGKCGEDAHWRLTGNGVLYIFGIGEIDTSGEDNLWTAYDTYDSKITSCVIKAGITSVSYLPGLRYVKTISLPASVTQLSYLFGSCYDLCSINVDASNPAYCDVDGILFSKDQTRLLRYPSAHPGSSYAVPDGITDIGEDAFKFCKALSFVALPGSVTRLDDNAFLFCSALRAITVAASNSAYCDVDGVLFSKDQTCLLRCPSARPGSSYVIPDGVTDIGKDAFYSCKGLILVAIPGSVARIAFSAFDSCSALSDVYYIGTEAQWNSISIGNYNDGLTGAARHYVPAADACVITVMSAEHGSISVDQPVVSKGKTVHVTAVPDGGYLAAVFLDGQPFSGTSFTASGNHTLTAVFSKKYDAELSGACGALVSWALTEDGVLHIFGSGAMEDFSSSYDLPWTQYREQIKRCEIAPGVTKIGEMSFYYCYAMTDISIPDSVTDIGTLAFSGCTKLKSVALPAGLSRIERGLFAYCDSLERIDIPCTVTSIGDQAFSNCASLTSVSIPGGVTRIGESAFYDCSRLASVRLPSSITEIDTYAFAVCSKLKDLYYVGTAETWAAITRASYSFSSNLKPHFLAAAADVCASDTTLYISADSTVPCTVLAAVYDGHTQRLICAQPYSIQAGCSSFTMDIAALGLTSFQTKIMLLNNANMPLCKAAAVSR